LAAVARVCRDPSVEGRDGARRHRTPHDTGVRRNATRSRATRNRRGKPMTIIFLQTDTPIGVLTLAADNDGLRRIDFPPPHGPLPGNGWQKGSNDVLIQAQRQLGEYFAGKRMHFELPLSPHGTDFQRAVWTTLAEIPYGGTW